MPLFHPKVISKHLASIDADIPLNHLSIISEWAESINNHSIYRQSETNLDGLFISKIVSEVLGYKPFGSSEWNVEKNLPIGSGNVDVALGFFHTGKEPQVLAPFELKGAKTKDLDAIMSGRGKTPVQQAWEYAMDAKGAKWVLVSNMVEIRFYAIGHGRKNYETFYIKELTNPIEYRRFILLLSASNLLNGSTENLLKESEIQGKEITNALYSDYKSLRLNLINTLQSDNPDYEHLEIINLSQLILDRILFIAFAEDRGLLPEKILEDAFRQQNPYTPQPIWQNFLGLFYLIDKGGELVRDGKKQIIPQYNGGLFKKNEKINSLKVPDSLCEGFKKLGDYNFNVENKKGGLDKIISVDVLGHIFEQSITDIEEIKAASAGIEFDKKKSKRKKDGVFYTPSYITEYIVEQAVGGWLNNWKSVLGFDKLMELSEKDFASVKTITKGKNKGKIEYNSKVSQHISYWEAYKEKMSSIKVLDPACGSGAFLNEVFDYLKAEGEQINNELSRLKGGQTELFRWDKHILANNVFGVDINPESVEITKLSLWLKTANRNEKLSYLEDNVKCGNSLIDDRNVAGDLAFNWQTEFSDIMDSGGFDVVIGNPPYVPTEHISSSDKIYLEKNYKSAFGRINLYPIFYEKGMQVLKENGFLGYITPFTILKNQYFIAARKSILESSSIKILVDFQGIQVFEDAIVDSIILVLKKEHEPNNKFLQITKISDFQRMEFDLSVVNQSEIKNNADLSFNVSSSEKFITRISKETIPLKKIINFNQGIITGSNKEFLTEIPSELTKKIITGSDFNRYSFAKSNNYIIYDANRLHRPRKREIFEVDEKILLRQTGGFPICMIDTEKYYTLDTVHNGLLIDKTYNSKFIIALLNSKLLRFLYEQQINEVGKIFAQVKIIYIDELPIKIAAPSEQEPFIQKVKVMLDKNLELYQLSLKFSSLLKADLAIIKLSPKLEKWHQLDFSDFVCEIEKLIKPNKMALKQKEQWLEYFNEQKSNAMSIKSIIEKTDKEIDTMVYHLYGLGDDEIRSIEENN